MVRPHRPVDLDKLRDKLPPAHEDYILRGSVNSI